MILVSRHLTMANELRAAAGLNFGAFQSAHGKPGAWLKSASALIPI
ncbi:MULTISPECIES: hypothetical protein [Thiomonas]|jgi:hypothetical protein|nr:MULTISPECIES: hypothetical protein [Thiomonas]